MYILKSKKYRKILITKLRKKRSNYSVLKNRNNFNARRILMKKRRYFNFNEKNNNFKNSQKKKKKCLSVQKHILSII